MAAPRKPASTTPEFVRHSKRPAWGVGRVTGVYDGLVRVQFADGVARAFRGDVLEAVANGDVPPEMLTQSAVAPPGAVTTRSRARKARTG
jgi:hypothetical protein